MKKDDGAILIDTNTLDNLAELSLLQFTEEEKKEIQNELNDMLSFFDVIHNVELGIEELKPQNQIVEGNKLRNDEPQTPLDKNHALANSSNHNEDFFLVPKILGDSN